MDQQDFNNKQKIESLFKIIQRIDFWINTTNAKAAFVTTLNTVYLGIFMSKWDEILSVYNSHPGMRLIVHLLFLVSTICASISLGLIFFAVSPYLISIAGKVDTSSQYRSALYFGDIASWETSENYHESMTGKTEEVLIKDLTDQIYTLSKAASKKFNLIVVSIWFLTVGVVFPMALVLMFKISISIGK